MYSLQKKKVEKEKENGKESKIIFAGDEDELVNNLTDSVKNSKSKTLDNLRVVSHGDDARAKLSHGNSGTELETINSSNIGRILGNVKIGKDASLELFSCNFFTLDKAGSISNDAKIFSREVFENTKIQKITGFNSTIMTDDGTRVFIQGSHSYQVDIMPSGKMIKSKPNEIQKGKAVNSYIIERYNASKNEFIKNGQDENSIEKGSWK